MPSGASCKSGVCDCADGHTNVRGRCRPLNGLDQTCETNLDCHFGYDRQSFECRNQVCFCTKGYYRRNGNICRRKSMENDDAGVVDIDCDELERHVKCRSLTGQHVNDSKDTQTASSATIANTQTKRITSPISEATSPLSKSSKSETAKSIPELVNGDDDDESNKNLTDIETESKTEPEQQQKSREIAIQTSIDAFELKPAIPQVKHVATATASTSTSSRRTFNYRHRQSIFRRGDDEKSFSSISNTDDDADDRKYGSSCTEDGKPSPALPHSICSNSICLCKHGHYNRNGKCFAELGEIAESTDECGNTFDGLSKRCICQKNYFYDRSLRSCGRPYLYHSPYNSNSQCGPFGTAFSHPDIPTRCTCEEYAEYDALQHMCAYQPGLGPQCQKNEAFSVPKSTCTNRYCGCRQNYFVKDNTCFSGIGANWGMDVDPNLDNVLCDTYSSDEKDRAYQWSKSFVHFKDECLKDGAEGVEDECIDSEQCKPLLTKCTCTPEQHIKYGRCEDKQGVDESHSKLDQGLTEKEPENVESRSSVCQCKCGYQADVEHHACIRVRPNNKNSSGGPSALKIITFLLIGSAFLITGAAIKQAYY